MEAKHFIFLFIFVCCLLPLIYRSSLIIRLLCVFGLLAVGSVAYFGVQSSDRLVLEKEQISIGKEDIDKCFDDAATKTRKIAAIFLPHWTFVCIGLAILAVIPLKKP